jgi:hypothetical protein
MRGQRPTAALYCEAREGLEVEGKPDVRGRPGSERGEEEGKVGRRRCWWAGREGGPHEEKERREEGRWAAHCCLAAGVAGLRARKERREREKRGRGLGSFLLSFFQTFSNSFFKLLKLNSFSNLNSNSF